MPVGWKDGAVALSEAPWVVREPLVGASANDDVAMGAIMSVAWGRERG